MDRAVGILQATVSGSGSRVGSNAAGTTAGGLGEESPRLPPVGRQGRPDLDAGRRGQGTEQYRTAVPPPDRRLRRSRPFDRNEPQELFFFFRGRPRRPEFS